MEQGHLFVPLWAAEGSNPKLKPKLIPKGSVGFHIERADAVVPYPSARQAQEFFKIYGSHFTQRSESLSDHDFTLNEEARRLLEAYKPTFDDVQLAPDIKVRRVTLKLSVNSFRDSPWAIPRLKPKFGKLLRMPEPPRTPGSKDDWRRGTFLPNWPGFDKIDMNPSAIYYIQYGSDTSLLQDQIRDLDEARERQIVDLREQTQEELAGLRMRLFWIGLATFAGILIGSLLLIHRGMSPIDRLSEAVSKVSARDFQLKVDVDKLPKELLPIADRLRQTLNDLRKAFTREKQAAADISHELRTPLAALLTTVELALRKPRSPDDYRELLQDCHLSGQQMMHLVERLLALARLDAGAERVRLSSVDVADLAQQCASLVRPLADARGISLSVHAETSVPVQADGGKLREIMNNLLHNAIQYNKPQGSIDLTVQQSNGRLRIQVRDTGIGISPEARTHIFERFYRADPSRHSDSPHAGLGLAIVKSYIDLMNGRIDVDSNGAATTFTVEVPVGSVEWRVTSETVAASKT